jgi:GMP synthase-like glutamine amidotransferase
MNRRVLLYVTLDRADHRDGEGGPGAHRRNFERLRDIAAAWRPGTRTEHRWCPELTPAALDDPSLLAVFLSGSFTEWVEAFRCPAWRLQLDAYAALVRASRAPMLAVCGSHQFLAYAYGGWRAVGHMPPAGQRAVSAADESDGVFRAPNPRVGETGVFAFRAERAAARADPILAGLPDRLHFVEYHHDQVLEDALPGCAVSLLAPDGADEALQAPAYDLGEASTRPGAPAERFTHRPVAAPGERCRVQALRYDAPPAGRLLYSVQFHPELDWRAGDPRAQAANAHGPALLRNFLNLSARYWGEGEG